jgi:DNA-packaging protein gp3
MTQTYDPKQQRYTPPRYSKPGKPTAYGEDVLNKAYEYLNECIDDGVWEEYVDGNNGGKLLRRHVGEVKFPNAGGLSVALRVDRHTLYDWAKVHPDFKEVMRLMNGIQQDRLMNGGLSGRYNPTIASLILGKHGYRRKIDNKLSNPDGSLSPMKQLTGEQLQAIADAEIAKNDKKTDDNS